jgi:Ca2+-transporting ATPase
MTPTAEQLAPAATEDPRLHLPPPPADESGLSGEEAAARLAATGPNRLVPERRSSGPLARLVAPFKDPMVALLLIAAPTYLIIGDYVDAAVVFLALFPIAAVGFVLEQRAERALERLRALTAPTVNVWRDGRYQTIPAEHVVPGDLAAFVEGDVIAADGSLVQATQLMTDESALTGESLPVVKSTDGDEAGEAAVFAGTTVVSGRGIVRITTTGVATRYGQIGALVGKIRRPPTPLQRVVGQLVRWMGVVAAVFCTAVVGLELIHGSGLGQAVIAGVSLAIAAIPEEFPMVYALYLSLGAWRLARDKALVRQLPSVETLGSTTVICSDKTGTLTLGQVEVAAVDTVHLRPQEGEAAERETKALLRAAVLACEPRPFDPLEQAIVRYAQAKGLDTARLHRGTLAADHAFDPHHKYLSHVWRHGDRVTVNAKGSLEGILDRAAVAEPERGAIVHANRAFADEGMRVLAVASGDLEAPTGDRRLDEKALRFRGLIAFSDPVRPGVTEALSECRDAGVRVVMITGDHPLTAHAIAENLGLPHTDETGADAIATGADLDSASDEELAGIVRRTNVFARTRPEQKHRLVQALRAQGQIVAMTGDGINDAPALREADIGVAMGQRGTEVARESAALVLLDDNFATIVAAVRNGRRIFENLEKAFAYLVAFHPPLLVAAFVVPLLGLPLLLLPIQLILLELIVHPVVALVFEKDPPAASLMTRPPRKPGSGFIGRRLAVPGILGLTLSAAVVGTYLVADALAMATYEARALGWAVLLIGQALLVFVVRSPARPIWQTNVLANRSVLPLVATALAVVPLTIFVPPLATLVEVAPFSPDLWLPAIAIAAAATLWTEPLKWLGNLTRPREA